MPHIRPIHTLTDTSIHTRTGAWTMQGNGQTIRSREGKVIPKDTSTAKRNRPLDDLFCLYTSYCCPLWVSVCKVCVRQARKEHVPMPGSPSSSYLVNPGPQVLLHGGPPLDQHFLIRAIHLQKGIPNLTRNYRLGRYWDGGHCNDVQAIVLLEKSKLKEARIRWNATVMDALFCVSTSISLG